MPVLNRHRSEPSASKARIFLSECAVTLLTMPPPSFRIAAPSHHVVVYPGGSHNVTSKVEQNVTLPVLRFSILSLTAGIGIVLFYRMVARTAPSPGIGHPDHSAGATAISNDHRGSPLFARAVRDSKAAD
jgi:hypothetical protein